jgi:hypothetical protein
MRTNCSGNYAPSISKKRVFKTRGEGNPTRMGKWVTLAPHFDVLNNPELKEEGHRSKNSSCTVPTGR